ncbi:3-isopropylmalate dehydratase small subunit [Peribacillus sp. B-H-3]|uniref:3-isopropylmalate dehydratase small subunit n=1 Tax=Peribacillus sp. B-H-3 TaxID=3400420 RepID=UPI003B028DBE
MNPITTYKGKAAVLDRENVDTDQIIPKQFLKRIERTGFGEYLFYNWRFDEKGRVKDDFELNHPAFKGASILLAGDNFGCGSSREHAPWSLKDYGFDIVIAPSFADIFYGNCLKNGLLPIQLGKQDVEELMRKGNQGGFDITVDLPKQEVSAGSGFHASFDIHPYWKEMLVNGWDEISITLQYEGKISDFENKKSAVSSI